MHKAFGASALPAYHPFMIAETRDFLRKLVYKPVFYEQHIRRYIGGLALSVIYGYKAKPEGDKLLALAEECGNIFTDQILSGSGIWAVDVIPALKYLPTWFPGAGFKVKAAQWRPLIDLVIEKPYAFVKRSMVGYQSHLLRKEASYMRPSGVGIVYAIILLDPH